jgi:hypothetical protein
MPNFFRTGSWIFAVIALLSLQACSGSSSSSNAGDAASAHLGRDGGAPTGSVTPLSLPAFSPPDQNVIIGRVVDSNGKGVAGATVTYVGGGTGTANYDGFYYIADVAPADRIVLTFQADGYVTTTGIGTMVAGGNVTVNAVMLQRGAGQPVNSADGGTVTFASGVVTLPPGTVTDSSGNNYSGSVMVHVTPVTIKGIGIQAAPGDFSATSAAGATVQLETFGMGAYELADSAGNPLQVKSGASVGVEMLLPAGTKLVAGQTVPAWHFDDQSGRWVEEGSGTVGVSSLDPARLSYKLNVGHFSNWNCDQPYDTTCVSGTVTSACDGSAIVADVRAGGISYDGSSTGFASASGQYCVAVKTGSTVMLTVSSGYGANRVVSAVQVSSGSATSACPGPCTVQDIVLPCTPADNDVDCGDDYFSGCKSCIQGRVVDDSGNPVAAMLKVKTGINTLTAVTDSSGHYCSSAALNILTTIAANAEGGAGTVTTTPTTPGACPNCNQAPDIVITQSQTTGTSSGIDFSQCPTSVGGIIINRLQANGTDPALAALDSGWILASKGDSSSGIQSYVISGVLVSSKAGGISFAPQATFELDLAAPPKAGAVYAVQAVSDDSYQISGDATSSSGAPVGMGSESYKIDTSSSPVLGSGQIAFSTGFANPGDPVKGSLTLTFGANCAAPSASLTVQATIDTVLQDAMGLMPTVLDPNAPAFKAWECSLFSLMSLTTAGFSTGAVEVSVDGVPMAGSNSLTSAEYSWTEDQLQISYYGDTGLFSATVDHPQIGANAVSSATYSDDSASGCWFTLGQGTVTLPNFAGADSTRWMTGSFEVDFTGTNVGSATASCGTPKATGQFGAPVCAGMSTLFH